MLAKLHKTHGSHRNYLKPKSDINTSFGLNHFAGVVFYDTRGQYCLSFSLNEYQTTKDRPYDILALMFSRFP